MGPVTGKATASPHCANGPLPPGWCPGLVSIGLGVGSPSLWSELGSSCGSSPTVTLSVGGASLSYRSLGVQAGKKADVDKVQVIGFR